MGARGRGRTLADRTVVSDPMERAVSPEAPRPPTTVPLWDLLRGGPAAEAAIRRGDHDDVARELYEMAIRHVPEMADACRSRLGEHVPGIPDLMPLADHPEVKPFGGFKRGG